MLSASFCHEKASSWNQGSDKVLNSARDSQSNTTACFQLDLCAYTASADFSARVLLLSTSLNSPAHLQILLIAKPFPLLNRLTWSNLSEWVLAEEVKRKHHHYFYMQSLIFNIIYAITGKNLSLLLLNSRTAQQALRNLYINMLVLGSFNKTYRNKFNNFK